VPRTPLGARTLARFIADTILGSDFDLLDFAERAVAKLREGLVAVTMPATAC
jgi:hypothetical protein